MNVPANRRTRSCIFISCLGLVWLMGTRGQQRAENRSVNCSDDGIAGERTGPGGTAHKLIPAEAEASANNRSNDDAQNHGGSHFQAVTTALAAFSSQALNWRGPENPTT